MDKASEQQGKNWSWLPAHMPGVAKLLDERKRTDGPAHVRECWHRGVVLKEPGWFFAREGALAVGVIWPAAADVAGWQLTPDQATLVLRPVEARHGA